MKRLDRQRPPNKMHRRNNTRPFTRGYASQPHPTWGDVPTGAENDKLMIAAEMDANNVLSFEFNTNECTNHHTEWNFGDGGVGYTDSLNAITHTYAEAGTYTVWAACHGQGAQLVVPVAGGGTPLHVDGITPNPMDVGGVLTATINGSGFVSGCTVRLWDGAATIESSVFQGEYVPSTVTPTVLTVDLDTAGWSVGTGGCDVWQRGAPSNQVQFTLI